MSRSQFKFNILKLVFIRIIAYSLMKDQRLFVYWVIAGCYYKSTDRKSVV